MPKYSKATYFAANGVAIDRLEDEIRNSAITVNLAGIVEDPTDIDITWNATPTAGDLTLLTDTLFPAHSGEPLDDPVDPTEVIVQTMPEPHPFAAPEFRTKNDATNWVTCPKNATTVIDYELTTEKYASGGEILYVECEQGDFVRACVYDTDSTIPEPYRAVLCEAWPIVAEYIQKRNILPLGAGVHGKMVIDTRPLNAKVTAGLYLRVEVVTVDSGIDRHVCVNYDQTVKL